MVKQISIIVCCFCQSESVIRFGTNATGKQRYRCRACKKTFVERPARSRLEDPNFVAQVMAACQERASMRGVARIFKISRTTLSALLKKSQSTT